MYCNSWNAVPSEAKHKIDNEKQPAWKKRKEKKKKKRKEQ